MDRELLGIFLRSGPARKYDVSYFTRVTRENQGENAEFLFKIGFLNQSIFFKTVFAENLSRCVDGKPVSMLVYLPYDERRPLDGGESFVFNEQNFWKYARFKLRSDSIDYAAFDADLRTLNVLDSVPTFSPLIVELAFDRGGVKVPPSYLDMTPETRSKLMTYLKDRIRPLVVAAYDRNCGVNVDRAVEDMTLKLLTLSDPGDIMPFVAAMRIPPEQAVEVLSSWIGITYFEHEYASMQTQLREFSEWIAAHSQHRWLASSNERQYLKSLMDFVRTKLKDDWGRIIILAKEYRETYSDMVYNNQPKRFVNFLLGCRERYWDMGDTLGRFEQTVIAWRQFRPQVVNEGASVSVLSDFFSLLRRVHGAPPRAPADALAPATAEAGGFSSLSLDLF
jgi:hypothetical protein